MNVASIISIINLAFCFFIFAYFKWYIKRRTSADEILSEYRTEVYRLIAEIDSATDRDVLLVEDRVKKIKAILEETDKRISVYARELERSRSGEALYRNLGRGIRAALKTEEPSQSEKPPESPPPTAKLSRRQIRSQIEALAFQGVSPHEIASKLNISLSEVNLALNIMSAK
jgi:ATP/maltotriose-dependent transcriptional regulator MalT